MQGLEHELNPFAVIESDPGVFTSLTRRLGIQGVEVVELYDIAPWAVDHLNPHGLIFCFLWKKDSHRPADFDDPAAERVWFANQLSDDACATHALLNVILNCPQLDVGRHLKEFRTDTSAMSPVMRGLAITNSPVIKPAHNYFARPSDIRASLNNLTITTFDAEKRKKKQKTSTTSNDDGKSPPGKRQRVLSRTSDPTKPTAKRRGRPPKKQEKSSDTEPDDGEEEETYHFIGYVPAYGKVWELDGLKSGPLEVGELPIHHESSSSSSHTSWMDVARPALRMKMEKYGGSGMDNSNIRFSLLAIVDDAYMKVHDEFELLKRERTDLEDQMDRERPDWRQGVDQTLLQESTQLFDLTNHPVLSSSTRPPTSLPESSRLPPFSQSFSAKRMDRQMELFKIPPASKPAHWEACVQNALRARTIIEDEISKAIKSNTDHIKRTFDYEPFIKTYVERLHNEGLLNALLDRDNDGRKRRGPRKGPKS